MSGTSVALPASVHDELLCIADTKWVLGHWYIKLIRNGRSLTDFNALAATAQDQLGHARALFSLLEQHPGAKEQLEFCRHRHEVNNMEVLDAPPANWADFLVTAALAEYALRVLLGAYREGSSRALAALATQCERECEFHSLYLDGGLQGLSASELEQARRSLSVRFALAMRWFADDDDIQSTGLRAHSLGVLRNQFEATCLQSIARHLGCDLPAAATADADFDQVRRRARGSAIPATLWEFVVPTNEQAVLCRRPLQISSVDSIRFTKGM